VDDVVSPKRVRESALALARELAENVAADMKA
jgi:hypothetical protein